MKLIKKLIFLALFLATVLFIGKVLIPAAAGRFFPLEYEDIIHRYAEQYGVEESLVAGVIRAESNFRPSAKSSAGAIGLMQLTPDTFHWLRSKSGEDGELTEDALYDPEINIKYGVYNLKLLAGRFADETARLAAYNAGPARVDGWLADPAYSDDGVTLGSIPYPETENYVKKIRQYTKIYQYIYYAD